MQNDPGCSTGVILCIPNALAPFSEGLAMDKDAQRQENLARLTAHIADRIVADDGNDVIVASVTAVRAR